MNFPTEKPYTRKPEDVIGAYWDFKNETRRITFPPFPLSQMLPSI